MVLKFNEKLSHHSHTGITLSKNTTLEYGMNDS